MRTRKGTRSERVIWPIAVAYYVQATLVGAGANCGETIATSAPIDHRADGAG